MDSSDEGLSPSVKAEITFQLVIYIVGVVANALVIFVILFLNEYKKTTHWYFLQLAIADFLFIQRLPFRVSELINGKSNESIELCRAMQTVLYVNYYASVLLLTVMALDRYLAVCHALSARIQRLRSRMYVFAITSIVWVLALLLSVPVMQYSDIVGMWPSCHCSLNFPRYWDVDERCAGLDIQNSTECLLEYNESISNQKACIRTPGLPSGKNGGYSEVSEFDDYNGNETTSGDEIYSEYIDFTDLKDDILPPECIHRYNPGFHLFLRLNFIVMFIIPFIVISVCYSLIVVRLFKTNIGEQNANFESTNSKAGIGAQILSRIRGSSSTALAGKSYKEKRRVTFMCTILVSLFLVCWLPFHVVHLVKINGINATDGNFCVTLSKVTSLLAYVNSALNPFVYNFLGTFTKRMRINGNRNRTRSVHNSSDASQIKRSDLRDGTRYTSPQSEGIPLQTIQDKSTVSRF